MANIKVDEVIGRVPTRLYVNGEWRDSSNGETFTVINPATEEKLADVASATPEDGMAALDAAVAAQREWLSLIHI